VPTARGWFTADCEPGVVHLPRAGTFDAGIRDHCAGRRGGSRKPVMVFEVRGQPADKCEQASGGPDFRGGTGAMSADFGRFGQDRGGLREMVERAESVSPGVSRHKRRTGCGLRQPCPRNIALGTLLRAFQASGAPEAKRQREKRSSNRSTHGGDQPLGSRVEFG